MGPLLTIAETPAFSAHADKMLTVEEREDLHFYLAERPEAGVVIPGSSGVRKLRWPAKGQGKRSGARIIYYFHDRATPLFLISIFTKNQKSDLDDQEGGAQIRRSDRQSPEGTKVTSE